MGLLLLEAGVEPEARSEADLGLRLRNEYNVLFSDYDEYPYRLTRVYDTLFSDLVELHARRTPLATNARRRYDGHAAAVREACMNLEAAVESIKHGHPPALQYVVGNLVAARTGMASMNDIMEGDRTVLAYRK